MEITRLESETLEERTLRKEEERAERRRRRKCGSKRRKRVRLSVIVNALKRRHRR